MFMCKTRSMDSSGHHLSKSGVYASILFSSILFLTYILTSAGPLQRLFMCETHKSERERKQDEGMNKSIEKQRKLICGVQGQYFGRSPQINKYIGNTNF